MLIVKRRFSLCVALVIIAFLFRADAPAQNQQQEISGPQQQARLNVMVLDKQGRAVEDARREELEVYEDGVLQKVVSFARETRPLVSGLVIDTSGSLRTQFRDVIKAAQAVIRSNDERDETFLVRFIGSERIEFLVEPTSDKARLTAEVEGLRVEGGASAVVDAVYLSVKKIEEYRQKGSIERRRALVLITDGEDRNSFYKKEQLINLLRESETQVFTIGLVNELDKQEGFIRRSLREEAVELLTKLAKESGGRAFFPDSAKDLPQVADEIARSLHTQYVVGYHPGVSAKSKPYRKLKVTVINPPGSAQRTVVARAGYTAPRR